MTTTRARQPKVSGDRTQRVNLGAEWERVLIGDRMMIETRPAAER